MSDTKYGLSSAAKMRLLRAMKAAHNKFSRGKKKAAEQANAALQKARNRIVGRQATHLIVAGFSRSGTNLFYNMLRHSAPADIYTPDHEERATSTARLKHRRLITKRPLDIFAVDETANELGSFRDLIYLVAVRDPRDLVSSMHQSVPNQYFQGVDYQFFVGKGPIRSYAYPGLAATHDAARALMEKGGRTFPIRYEDILADPERVRTLVNFATGFGMERPFSEFASGQIPERLRTALNGLRPVKNLERPAWTNNERLARVCHQIRLFPQLEEMAAFWGYPPFDEVCARYGLTPPDPLIPHGTIVAFHTDDAIYRAEAQRFTNRLDQLGLKYDMTVVLPRSQWVENCAMKSEFLLDARKRLRGPLLYLDVDAYVHTDPWPYLSQYDTNLAGYVHKNGNLNSATLLLGDDVATVSLLEKWVSEQKKVPMEYDQRVLQHVIERDEASAQPKFSFQRLPPNMNYIFDRKFIYVFGAPIVEQLQVSREVKSIHRGKIPDTRRNRINELFPEG